MFSWLNRNKHIHLVWYSANAFYRKIKSISINWYPIFGITLIFILTSNLSFSRLCFIDPTTVCTCFKQDWNICINQLTSYLSWETFSHFSSAMRSFVRQVHYIDRDLIVAHLLKGLGSLNLCSVLRSLQTPMGFLRFHRHYHFDNSFTIIYNKSANNYLKWFVSHCLNDSDLLFKVQLFNVHFL